jgi:bifunctional oligoribonuclease and PAP phosphatase NrnA
VCAKSSPDRAALAQAIGRSRSILLTSHIRPDGDALGSCLALHLAAQRAGKQSRLLVLDGIPSRYRFLFAGMAEPICPQPMDAAFAAAADQADLIVLVDTSSYTQLAPIADVLKARRDKIAVIDHHATADDAGRVAWRDQTAAASAVMVEELLVELSWPLTVQTALPLATALTTDTGWLHYSNADARAIACLGKLVEAGVKLNELYATLYQTDSAERVKLLARALDSMELHAGGRLAVVCLRKEDFAATGAAEDESEDFASEPLRIASVEVACTLIWQDDGVIRVSLRSRRTVDVAAIARACNGGGHVRAAGCRFSEDIDSVKRQMIDRCTKALAEAGMA